MEGAKGSEVSRELCLTERRRDSRPDNEEDDERRFGRSLQLDVVQAFRKLHEARRRRELAFVPDGTVSSPRPHPRRGVRTHGEEHVRNVHRDKDGGSDHGQVDRVWRERMQNFSGQSRSSRL